MTLQSLLLAAAGGLFVTIVATLLLPPRWGHLRPVVAAILGFGVAYGLTKLTPLLP